MQEHSYAQWLQRRGSHLELLSRHCSRSSRAALSCFPGDPTLSASACTLVDCENCDESWFFSRSCWVIKGSVWSNIILGKWMIYSELSISIFTETERRQYITFSYKRRGVNAISIYYTLSKTVNIVNHFHRENFYLGCTARWKYSCILYKGAYALCCMRMRTNDLARSWGSAAPGWAGFCFDRRGLRIRSTHVHCRTLQVEVLWVRRKFKVYNKNN